MSGFWGGGRRWRGEGGLGEGRGEDAGGVSGRDGDGEAPELLRKAERAREGELCRGLACEQECEGKSRTRDLKGASRRTLSRRTFVVLSRIFLSVSTGRL